MSTLLLERPASWVAGPGGRREQRLRHLRDELERWLPREEARLSQARASRRGRSLDEANWLTDEAYWMAMLRLYERLTTALGPRPA